ncbi:MAG: type IV toxin-antitoxin system AbiEi family antitoxin domain-containing protein [Nocardioides sp.]
MSSSATPHHPFVLADLTRLGLTRSRLRAMVADGAVRRVLRGVYAPASLPDTPETRARCAALVLPPHCVVSDLAAAWIWGINGYDPEALDIAPALDVVSIGGPDRTRRPELVGGKRTLRDDDLVDLAGLRITSPLRTACDVACLRGRHRALAVLDGFCRRSELELADFHGLLPRYRGRRGCRQLRELVQLADARAESPGSPGPGSTSTMQDCRHTHSSGSVRPGEPHVSIWPTRLRIAVEYDGQQFHGIGSEPATTPVVRRSGGPAAVIVVTKDDLSAVR